MELGLTSFAETHADPATGQATSHGERLRQVIAEVEKAEEVGLEVYGLGEHHRVDMAASAPAITLAAAAARTERIRLSSAVRQPFVNAQCTAAGVGIVPSARVTTASSANHSPS